MVREVNGVGGGSSAELVYPGKVVQAKGDRTIKASCPSKSRGAQKINVRGLSGNALEIGSRIAYGWSGYRSCGGGAQGGWTALHRCLEGNAARNPVNQWIVVGEPAMSQDDGTGAIQRSDIERRWSDLTRGEVDREVNGLHNCGVGSPIEQMELKRRHRKGMKSIIINE